MHIPLDEVITCLQVTTIYKLILTTNTNFDLGGIAVKYKDYDTSNKDNLKVPNSVNLTPSIDANFLSSIVQFGLILIDSNYKLDSHIDSVIKQIE